jgi:DNA-binding NtrC family response regulator
MREESASTGRPFPESAGARPALVLAFSGSAGGGGQPRQIPRGGLVLGRDAAVFDDAFRDPRMAARHAEVRLEGGRAVLRDLGSEAGTRLNGHLLISERALEPGDVIRLGDTLVVYALSASVAPPGDPELIGDSAAMAAVRRSIDAVAGRSHSVVVQGETGTGKEVVARLLHQRSKRTGPFIAVNCGSFTEGLLASDLFGHVRGAFTGAISDEQGLFRAADGGTLMLDEVAEIPPALQANLLRVLEMHEVRPVGGTRNVATDVRVIATSNRELTDLVRAGSFRADLYSRLAQWTVRLPLLRDRREDIPALTRHLLGRCEGLGRTLTPDLAEALLLHDWPLNVRGLLNVLSVAVVSSPDDEPLALGSEVRLVLSTTRSLAAGSAPAEPATLDKADLVRLMERFHGKVAAAAHELGISRSRLYRRLQAQELKPGQASRTPGSRSRAPDST